MIGGNDPRQGRWIDPWEHLGPKRRKRLENSWAGLCRQVYVSQDLVEHTPEGYRPGVGHGFIPDVSCCPSQLKMAA
jgi:hypothetical protein